MGDATTHWSAEDLTGTGRSVHVLPEDRQAAYIRFEATEHRPPTSHEQRSEGFHALEIDVAQNRYNQALESASEKHPAVDPITLKSLLIQESAMDPYPGRDDGAYQGIAQLGSAEATSHGVAIDRHDPVASIDAAARVLTQKDSALERLAYSKVGAPQAAERTKFMLAAYNGGEGTIATAILIAHDDAYAVAEKRGESKEQAESVAREFATKFENLTEPRSDVSKSPLYRAAEQRLTSSDPHEKYTEISEYAEQITARVMEARSPKRETRVDRANPLPDQGSSEARQNSVNARIAESAERLRGMSTRDSATHHPELENGQVACAYAVNTVLESALGRRYGSNPEYVPSVMADLRRNGREVSQADARPGDIAIRIPSHGEAHGHIGVVTSAGPSPDILSNSSSRGSFDSDQTPAAFGRNYLTGGHDQVVFVRIDPNSVHRELAQSGAPESAAATRVNDRVHRTPTDYTRPDDPKILGETRHGQLVETPQELATKNALLDRAAEEARSGVKPTFRFVGDGHESHAEVERQNAKLDHAIDANFAKTSEERGVEPWTPEMSFEKFKQVLGRIRNGVAPIEQSHEPARAQDRTIEH